LKRKVKKQTNRDIQDDQDKNLKLQTIGSREIPMVLTSVILCKLTLLPYFDIVLKKLR